MARHAGPGVSRESRGATRGETRWVRGDAPRPPDRTMAGHTIPLDVAARALRHRPARLRPVGFDPQGRMEAAPRRRRGRRDRREPKASVTLGAEALRRVTARAARHVALSHCRVGRQEVAAVHAPDVRASIVAVDALTLRVAFGTKRAPIGRHPAMPDEEVPIVVCAVKPARGQHAPLAPLDPQAPIGELPVAGTAGQRRRGSLPMATETRSHRRKMTTGRDRRVGHIVAHQAAHPFPRVKRVRKGQTRQRERRGHDRSRRTEVTKFATTGAGSGPRLAGVTGVACGLSGHEPVSAPGTAGRAVVTANAAEPPMRWVGVIHPDRDALGRVDDVRTQGTAPPLTDRQAEPGPEERNEEHRRGQATGAHRQALTLTAAKPRRR